MITTSCSCNFFGITVPVDADVGLAVKRILLKMAQHWYNLKLGSVNLDHNLALVADGLEIGAKQDEKLLG